MHLSDAKVDSVTCMNMEPMHGSEIVGSTNSSRRCRRKQKKRIENSNFINRESDGVKAIGTASPTLSSTPRRRREFLLNSLQSNLSPNYIGFITPPSAGMEDGSRSLRRRANARSVEATNSQSMYYNKTPLSIAKRLSVTLSPFRKPFVSPIDKLLLKNGSTIVQPDHDMSEENYEDVILVESEAKTTFHTNIFDKFSQESEAKTQSISEGKTTFHTNIFDKCSQDSEPLPDGERSVECVDLEDVGPYNLVYEHQNNQNTEEVLNTRVFINDDAHFASIIVLNDLDNSTTEIGEVSQEKTEMPEISDGTLSNIGKISQMNENSFGVTADQCKSDDFVIGVSEMQNELVATEAFSAYTVEAASSKSPSSLSVDSAKGSSIENDTVWMSFSTGDLFWGQIYTYSYWPCMVCPDPDGKTITTEENGRTGEHHVLVHVRFFADNGRRNWVKRENFIPYNGLENYNNRVQEIKNKFGIKSNKYKVLVPKRYKLPIWHEAVNEANLVAETPHEGRLEKFYNIYEKSRAFQRFRRKRRDSMFLEPESTLEMRSTYESSDDLTSKQMMVKAKRERSVSPFSLAYSSLEAGANKRRKLSEERAIALLQPYDVEDFSSDRGSNDFRRFYLIMKDFVMGQNDNKELEKSLGTAVRNIWTLKEISQTQIQNQLLENYNEHSLGSSVVVTGQGEGSVKRLSNRLKHLMVRRNFPIQKTSNRIVNVPFVVQKEKNTSAEDRRIKPVNRPIEEVVNDIFNLDRKYLFKDMGRGPICKYCFQPVGKLDRCLKSCQMWFHISCNSITHSQTKQRSNRFSGTSLTKQTNQTAISVAAGDAPYTSVVGATANITIAKESKSRPVEDTDHITAEFVEPAVDIVCRECALGKEQPVCNVCGGNEVTDAGKELVPCNMPQCSNRFHQSCCKYWPQSKFTKSKNHIESFRCPSHVCHTCVSDDPKGKFQHLGSSKLTKCVKCPATYHTDSTCIPAGSQILTAAHIICPRHSNAKSDTPMNVNWCFICGGGGGQVVCCETCPTAVHTDCINISIDTNEGYICEECESGRLPLYGEMVWAKFNTYRWWPAIILPPTEIPQNILRKTHNPSDFVVRFFGTHDHAWIARRRVYLYLEGDSSEPPRLKTALDHNYSRGVKEAKKIYEMIKSKKLVQRLANEGKEKLYPQPYVRIKANRSVPPVKLHIDLEKVNRCECSPTSEQPCGPDSNCLNRVLYHECNPKLCPAGIRCQNQIFESRISPRLDVVYMKERGFGLVCREPLAEGIFVIEYVGEIINDIEFKQRLAQKSVDRDENFYFLSVEKDYIIDAGPKGNLARFMNHSCEPNCETQKWLVNGLNRIGLFTIKNIPANTELTFNYHWDELLGSEKKRCLCGAIKCAGQIGGKYKDDKAKEQLEVQNNPKVKITQMKKTKPLKRLQKQKQQTKSKKHLLVKVKLNVPAARRSKKNATNNKEDPPNTNGSEVASGKQETNHICN